jgi:sugar lactone lactonase YvrE
MLIVRRSSSVRSWAPDVFFLRVCQFVPAALLAFATALGAQSVNFSGNQTVLANGFAGPQSTAVDSSGYFFVVDSGNTRVMKVAPGASADCSTGCTQIANGFVGPIGIALDASGNAFVTDSPAGQLVKVSTTGTKTTIATLTQPGGLAMDASGNSYVSLMGGSLVKVTPAGIVSTVVSGLNQPAGVAIDASGNLYVADSGNNQVVKIASGGGQSTVVTGLNTPLGVAVDAAGVLYVGDTNNNRVLKLPAGTSNLNCASGCVALGTGLTKPLGLSVDASGNVYFSNGTAEAVKIATDVDFGSTNVAAATPASRTLLYQLTGSDCSTANTVNVLTKGAPAKDFAYTASADVCTPGSPTTFSVTVNFTPRFAGLRTGAVQLVDGSGTVQATTYLHGIGTGPQVTWTPGVASTVVGTP